MSKFVTLHGFGGSGGAGGSDIGSTTINLGVLACSTVEDLNSITSTENNIVIITDTEITSFCYSDQEPTNPTEGLVWINIDLASTSLFPVGKDNLVYIYPGVAKQYISNTWVEKDMYNYQNGRWNKITSLITIVPNIDFAWETRGAPTFSKTETSVTITAGTNGGNSMYAYAPVTIVKKKNLSLYINATIAHVDGGITSSSSSYLGIFDKSLNFITGFSIGHTARDVQTINQSYDISSLDSGEYYVGYRFTSNSGSVYTRRCTITAMTIS